MAKQRAFIIDPSEILDSGKKTRTRKPNKAEPQIYDCSTCGLSKNCKKPKINKFGDGNKRILIIGLCPGRTEDKYGIPLIGESGKILKEMLAINGIDMDKDCVRTNVVRCYPGKDTRNKDIRPTGIQVKCCANQLQEDILETKPELILCLGTEAIQSVIKTDAISGPNATTLHGKVFPYHSLNCWVGCSMHPSFFLHREHEKNGIDDKLIMAYDLANILSVIDVQLPKIPTADGNKCITNHKEAIETLHKFCNSEEIVGFDYETTTLEPHMEGADLLSVAITDSEDYCYFIPISAKVGPLGRKIWTPEERTTILEGLKEFIDSRAPKTCQNYFMEEIWSRVLLGVSIRNFVHDTMVSSHILNYSNKGCTGLEFQAFERTGHEYKVDRSKIDQLSIEDLCTYNSFDSRHTIALCHQQINRLASDAKLSDFNSLFTRSLKTFANLKSRGIRIDVARMNEMEAEYAKDSEACLNEIRKQETVKDFERRTGKEFNPDSSPQWEVLLYDMYGVEKTKERMTPTGRGSTSAETLEEIKNTTDNQPVKDILEILFKHRSNIDILKKISEYRRLMHPDGKIHSTFWLNTADTFRSSASGPNCHNTYKHDPKKKKFRRIIIPEPGQLLLEADYKAHEARVIGMASGDVELIKQTVEKIDIHKKWAGKIFNKPIDLVNSDEKYSTKNQFVFPSIYGANAHAIAGYFGMKYPVEYFQKLQDEFWAEFKGVHEWQKSLIKFYCENGYIEGLSGFRIHGPLSIYQIYNYPIQGPAFHLLLDSLNRDDEYLITHGFESMIINEIHDSMVFSASPDETNDVIEITTEIMKSKRFDWQIVPLDVSWEIGENWYDMEEV